MNSVVFQNNTINPSRIIFLATKLGEEYLNANKNSTKVSKGNQFIKWILPSRGNLKINFDGSVINSHVAAGFVVRDENGRPILAGARNLGESSNNVAECVALGDALWMARCRGFTRIQIEGDLKLVIDFMEILFELI